MRFLVLACLSVLNLTCLAEENEIEMAKEAAPAHITQAASFGVWNGERYAITSKGTNGFLCVVVRDDKGRFEPSCFNPPAVAAVLPVYEYLNQMLDKCMDIKSIYKKIDEKAKAGVFPKPEPGAVVYMMSKRNKFYDHFGKTLMDIPPHVMMYSPKIDEDVLGFNGTDGLPSFYQEFPHLSVIHLETKQ